MACNISGIHIYQYNSAAGTAFLVTLILLLILLFKSSLRQSSIFRTIEIVICVILTIFYVVGSVDIIRACWYWLFNNFRLGPFIGSLIASVSVNHSMYKIYMVSLQQSIISIICTRFNIHLLFCKMTQICSVLATFTYLYDAIDKFRESRGISTSNV